MNRASKQTTKPFRPPRWRRVFARLGEEFAAGASEMDRWVRKNLGWEIGSELYYLVPRANWATDWAGFYITRHIRQTFGWRTHLAVSPRRLSGHIVHYGELGAFIASLGSARNTHNDLIATIYHGNRREDFPELKTAVERFLDNLQLLQRVVCTCHIMEERLVGWGVDPEMLVRIPLGVDINLFQPAAEGERKASRQKYAIPEDAFCIGSFHKDGVGWEEGLEPKLVKGPDVFLQVIQRLHKHYRLHILLTAPARGYLKQGLQALGVPFSHIVLPDYRMIPELYHCLDAYLVTSREEGGPKALLESLASGVPLVSTRVGLAPDILEPGRNGLLAEPEDAESLARQVAQLIEQEPLRRRLAANGLADIPAYDWERIAARYYRELYLPVLGRAPGRRSGSTAHG